MGWLYQHNKAVKKCTSFSSKCFDCRWVLLTYICKWVVHEDISLVPFFRCLYEYPDKSIANWDWCPIGARMAEIFHWNTNVNDCLLFIRWIFSHNSMVSCQKGPICHARAWRVGLFWQDTIELCRVIANMKKSTFFKSKSFVCEPSVIR